VNLAPYSFFNACGTDPHYVMFASGGRKDSQRNAEETGEFVCLLATYDLKDKMNATSAQVDADIDEMKLAGLTPVPSTLVRPPRAKESPVAFECRYHQTISLPGKNGEQSVYSMVLGQVLGIHIDDGVIADGLVDVSKMRPIARLGYQDYSVVDTIFTLQRPR
ncbi:MAG: flavin reductase family protein, partial [Methyloligellaceae bacterium]